ncbi:dienelactone hydrolase [Sphingobium sp. SCG-1]|uniref:dienelactone hydrolase family protein n=1 Tax=Sphingobium sp. SCG-1 TaxID=2072936 RepID=UPI000CD67C08|nr:dienelactone hydrolase family protein [Sphingobium sp. SCG-1]AUW59263.1 dienelactone hydrolase [Sphingobium sp. SCG-1]
MGNPVEPLLYEDGDTVLHGELYLPVAPANGQAVLVVHEADGIGGNVRRHCRRLSHMGYIVLAADMHGGGQVLEGEAMRRALDRFRAQPDLVRQRVNAGFEALLSVAKVSADHSAAIGFCFGGFAVLELARSGAHVAAVASFHGLLTTMRPATSGRIRARLAVFTGARDPLVPALDVATFQQEMSAAEADWQMTVYDNALHSFTNPDVDQLNDPRMAYDDAAHRLSWNALIDFLDASLPQHRA